MWEQIHLKKLILLCIVNNVYVLLMSFESLKNKIMNSIISYLAQM